MPRKHLTDVLCQTITAEKQTRYWDTTMKGFGITVGPRSKTFMVMTGTNRQLITLGQYPELTLARARREAHRVLGTHSATESITFADARSDFIAMHCARNNRPRTAAETARLLNRIDFPGRLDQITRREIQSAFASFPPSSANHTLVALKTLFNWCVERGMIKTSPLLRAKLPHKAASRDRVLTDVELARIWQAASDLGTFGTIVHLLILTGLRRNEVASLQVSWFSDTMLTVPRSITKNKREHLLPLGPIAEKIVETRMRALHAAPPHTLLFPAFDRETAFSGWSKAKKRIDRTSGVADWTLHDLRRTFATIHAKLKTPPHIIEALLNHASGQISGVAAVYNRYQYEDEKRAAMDRYENCLTALLSAQ